MNRRNFLSTSSLLAAGAFLLPSPIQNSQIYDPKEFYMDVKTISVYELERMVATNSLIFGYDEPMLTKWKEHISQTSGLQKQIDEIKQTAIGISLINAREFQKIGSKEKPRSQTPKNILGYFDVLQEQIDYLKKITEMQFAEHEGKTILLNSYARYSPKNPSQQKSPVENAVYYILNGKTLANRYILVDSKGWFSNQETSERNLEILDMIATIDRLSPEAPFIRQAAEVAGFSLEEIIAFAHIESSGREFAVSEKGAVGRFQINSEPEALIHNYRKVVERPNELSNYIKQKTSPATLFNDLVSNPRLNAAFGINLMDYKRQELGTSYPVAYLMGISGTRRLSKKTRGKIANPSKITKRDLKNKVIRYYDSFRKARGNFSEIREYLT